MGAGELPKKAPWIFPYICDLHAGRALYVVTGEVTDLLVVDLFVAGFVCKSVSTEKHKGVDIASASPTLLARQERPSRARWAKQAVQAETCHLRERFRPVEAQIPEERR